MRMQVGMAYNTATVPKMCREDWRAALLSISASASTLSDQGTQTTYDAAYHGQSSEPNNREGNN